MNLNQSLSRSFDFRFLSLLDCLTLEQDIPGVIWAVCKPVKSNFVQLPSAGQESHFLVLYILELVVGGWFGSAPAQFFELWFSGILFAFH